MEEEQRLSEIYHPLWCEFNESEKVMSSNLFSQRLKTNGFDTDWFKDKICLDAGCGYGRYLKAMSKLRAKEIVGIDLNIDVSLKNIYKPNCKTIKGDIRNINYPDNYFDFVCCNGVLHHTKDPEAIIKELNRVLKPGGYLFLFVFSEKTLNWKLMDSFRDSVSDFTPKEVSTFFKLFFNKTNTEMFNFIDCLYAPIQRKFTKKELNKLLKNYDIKYMSKPVTYYDSCEDNRLIARKI